MNAAPQAVGNHHDERGGCRAQLVAIEADARAHALAYRQRVDACIAELVAFLTAAGPAFAALSELGVFPAGISLLPGDERPYLALRWLPSPGAARNASPGPRGHGDASPEYSGHALAAVRILGTEPDHGPLVVEGDKAVAAMGRVLGAFDVPALVERITATLATAAADIARAVHRG